MASHMWLNIAVRKPGCRMPSWTTSKNDHSVFVTELLREMRTPGVSGEQVLRNTQAGVISGDTFTPLPGVGDLNGVAW